MKNKVLLIGILTLYFSSINVYGATTSLLTWDLVDSGKHLDWVGTSNYISQYNSAVNTWENYKSGIIRKDTLGTLKDMTISDYSEVSSTAGITSPNGTLKFNSTNMDDFSDIQKENVALHELGHALGLAHNTSSDVMYMYVSTRIALSTNDKASYDLAYINY